MTALREALRLLATAGARAFSRAFFSGAPAPGKPAA